MATVAAARRTPVRCPLDITPGACCAPMTTTASHPDRTPQRCPATAFHGRAVGGGLACACMTAVGPRLGKSHGWCPARPSAATAAMTAPA